MKTLISTSLLALAFSLNLHAAETHADHDHSTAAGMQQHQELLQKDAQAASSATTGEWADGEVRKVDTSAAKITLKHGPLPNLGMGAMTMVYRVASPAMLEQVKAGERVRFQADSINGALTITQIEKAP
jgi:Cu/Ag efflux protein CusF